MPSFGEKLKLEREKRKITLEQISVSTKIGTRMLHALEEDKFSQLPGGIFNKGFVRAYARFVGLDEDQTVADYLQASGDAPPVQSKSRLAKTEIANLPKACADWKPALTNRLDRCLGAGSRQFCSWWRSYSRSGAITVARTPSPRTGPLPRRRLYLEMRQAQRLKIH